MSLTHPSRRVAIAAALTVPALLLGACGGGGTPAPGSSGSGAGAVKIAAIFSGPSNAPLRKRNVVRMRPSGSFAYDSTAA